MSKHDMDLMYQLKRYSLVELEEIMEKIRTEVLRRELAPMKYEVAALRQQISTLEQALK